MTNNDVLYIMFLEIMAGDQHPTLKFIKCYSAILDAYFAMQKQSDFARQELMNNFIEYLKTEIK